jgi:hypothetical protein
MKRISITVLVLFALALNCQAATVGQVLNAIRTVETGGKDITGDNGAAIGPYQIHRSYWQDSGVAGKYEDCHDDAYSRKVILAYWKRYCPKALAAVDAQTLTRVHNGGGPKGATTKATVAYWLKVQKVLGK